VGWRETADQLALPVIASEAKQSTAPPQQRYPEGVDLTTMDCFALLAMTEAV
jgi:hypothetical protein